MSELSQLRKFVDMMFEMSDWPEGGDIDQFDFQEACIECGILVPETRYAPCSEEEGECWCAGYYSDEEFDKGITCYRRKK